MTCVSHRVNGGGGFETPNVTVHPTEGRREAPVPVVGCNGLLDGAAMTSCAYRAP